MNSEQALQELLEPNPKVDVPKRPAAKAPLVVRTKRSLAIVTDSKVDDRFTVASPPIAAKNPGSRIPKMSRVSRSKSAIIETNSPESNSVRVFFFGGLRLQGLLENIEAGGETISFLPEGKSGHLVLTLRQVSQLVELLRRRAGIVPESLLFIRIPESDRLILISDGAESTHCRSDLQSLVPTLQYRLECHIFECIVNIDVYEQPAYFEMPAPDPTVRKSRSPAERIVEVLERPSSQDYDRLSLDLDELLHLVQQEIAVRLTPVLKQKMQEMPHHTYKDKQVVTKWVTSELRQYGLAVQWKAAKVIEGRREERAYSACLVTDMGNHPNEGRFQVHYRDENGKVVRPLSTPDMSVLLKHFDVMVDDPTRYRAGKWADRMGRPNARPMDRGE